MCGRAVLGSQGHLQLDDGQMCVVVGCVVGFWSDAWSDASWSGAMAGYAKMAGPGAIHWTVMSLHQNSALSLYCCSHPLYHTQRPPHPEKPRPDIHSSSRLMQSRKGIASAHLVSSLNIAFRSGRAPVTDQPQKVRRRSHIIRDLGIYSACPWFVFSESFTANTRDIVQGIGSSFSMVDL